MARDITKLHPRLQDAIKKIQEKFSDVGIGECFRTVAEQDALYAQGRTVSGKIVTNAKGSTYSSQHQWGIAFDFFKNIKGHEFDDAQFFKDVAAYAKSIGLAWGGDWKSPVDTPHLYLPDWGSTPAKLKQQYGTPDKFIATWTKQDTGKSVASSDSVAAQVKKDSLTVDGIWGPATIKRLQQIFKTTQDGVISNQYSSEKTRNPGLAAATGWEWKTKPSGSSALIKAIQKKVGTTQDGYIGKNTITAMQKWLGTTQDGVISNPSAMVKALQKWANQQ